MKVFNLNDMTKGWFVGDFDPTVIKTKNCEVSVKRYKKGDVEDKHYHLIADEITVVISGMIRMRGMILGENDIILVERGEATAFECLENAVTVVYKSISIKNDKYICVDNKYQLEHNE